MNLYKDIKESSSNKPYWLTYKLPDSIISSIFIDNNKETGYFCNNCKKYFMEPKIKRTNMEHYYGVSDLFPDSHYQDLAYCPFCNDENIEEFTLDAQDIVEDFLDYDDNVEKVCKYVRKHYPDSIIENSDIYSELDSIPEELIYEAVSELISYM